jgi:MFS family permease
MAYGMQVVCSLILLNELLTLKNELQLAFLFVSLSATLGTAFGPIFFGWLYCIFVSTSLNLLSKHFTTF